MVFDKIDINGDGEELSYAMPNTAPTSPLPAVQAARAIPDVGCPKAPGHGESWQGAALCEGLAPRPLHGMQLAPGDAANCPSLSWQHGDLRGV